LQTHFLERLLHLIKFERLDDRLYLFHRVSSPGSKAGTDTRNRRLVSRSRAKARTVRIA
jgi:hypothetical protein